MCEEWAEIVPVGEGQRFVDESGREVEAEEIRFGMRDAAGVLHYFRVRWLEAIPEYEAREIYPAEKFRAGDPAERTEYSFRAFGYRKPKKLLLAELLNKMETALMNPAVEREKWKIPGTGRYMERRRLRERGYAQIEDRDGKTCFRIDGKLYSPDEFADMLGGYDGFLLTWQVRDALNSDIPDHSTYYLPVSLSEELLLNELEQLIAASASGEDFISWRGVDSFQTGFFTLCDKLQLYCRSNLPGVGRKAGLKLIHRLEALETDDNTFPGYEIEMIREIIGE